MSVSFDIAIIGAGPAGMRAAITASKEGASVVVLDDKPRGGGLIYKNVTQSPLPDPSKMGVEYLQGKALVNEFEQCEAEKIFEASVWHVGDDGMVHFTRQQQTHSLSAKEIIVCSGAMERPFPVPGWELAGVMSAGSAQVMLKSEAVACDDAVFVGTGPLLYLVVAQYLRLGVKVKALVDTTPMSAYIKSVPQAPGAVSQTPMLIKGMGMLASIYRAGVPVYRSCSDIRIEGESAVASISFKSGNKQHQLGTDHVFLHQGVIPNLNITRALGVKHEWNTEQLCWAPKTDEWGQSSEFHISVAGDCGLVVGADGSESMGQITALNLLTKLGYLSEQERDKRSQKAKHKRKQLISFRRFIDKLYRAPDADRMPEDPETVVCRCEEKKLGQLKAGFEQGAKGPNELKVLTRCGMGPCQGRQCGHTISELLAKWQKKPMEEVSYFKLRSPMKLLNLTELSHFNKIEPASKPALTGEPV